MNSEEFITVERHGHVNVLMFSRPPHNYFTVDVIAELLAHLQASDADDQCRATVLAAHGKVFCAGGEFGMAEEDPETYISMARGLYAQAMQLFKIRKPLVAAVQGPAIGAGLGLALVADFRVSCETARFSANFNRLGLHPGFGMSVTLPRLIGVNAAELMLYTGRRFNGKQAFEMGLVNELVERENVFDAALALAQEIAGSGPNAVQDTRATLRDGLFEQVSAVNKHELDIQIGHMQSAEFREGVRATAERREPIF